VARLPRTAPIIKKIKYHILGLLKFLGVTTVPQGAAGIRFETTRPSHHHPVLGLALLVFRKSILSVNFILVIIWLILINTAPNGLRSYIIPEENHFPKPGVYGIINYTETCSLITPC
jgi:hypothetical protein